MSGIFDKHGTEIRAGMKLHNQHDAEPFYLVTQDEHGNLFLGDLDSPLEWYMPHEFWEVVS